MKVAIQAIIGSSLLTFCIIQFLAAEALAPLNSVAYGETSNPQQEAQQLYGEYMSPFCPGRLLADCGSSGAADLRDEIRSALDQGISADEIRNQLEHTYGVSLRASPKAAGWGLLAWLVPAAFLNLSLISVCIWLAGQRRAVASSHVPQSIQPVVFDLDLQERLRTEINSDR